LISSISYWLSKLEYFSFAAMGEIGPFGTTGSNVGLVRADTGVALLNLGFACLADVLGAVKRLFLGFRG
jgi:hypothetical protein